MSTADHATCCCAETIDDIRALEGFYEAALHDRNELAGRLNQSAADLRALEAAYRAATARADAMEARIKDTLGERDRARNLAARLEDQLAQVAIAVENLAALAGLLRGFEPGAAAVLDGATRGLREILHPEDGAIVPVDPRLTDQIRAHRKEADSGGLAPENAATGRCCAGDGIPEAGAACDSHQDRR